MRTKSGRLFYEFYLCSFKSRKHAPPVLWTGPPITAISWPLQGPILSTQKGPFRAGGRPKRIATRAHGRRESRLAATTRPVRCRRRARERSHASSDADPDHGVASRRATHPPPLTGHTAVPWSLFSLKSQVSALSPSPGLFWPVRSVVRLPPQRHASPHLRAGCVSQPEPDSRRRRKLLSSRLLAATLVRDAPLATKNDKLYHAPAAERSGLPALRRTPALSQGVFNAPVVPNSEGQNILALVLSIGHIPSRAFAFSLAVTGKAQRKFQPDLPRIVAASPRGTLQRTFVSFRINC